MARRFVPQTGQTDYTHIRWAPVINCVVQRGGKILLVQRSKELQFYPECWNGISGFLDNHRSLEEKVQDELHEELGIGYENIVSITPGTVFDQDEPAYNKTWIVHPVLVQVKTEKIALDWEATTHRWVSPTDARTMKLLPGFDRVLNTFFRSGAA